MRLVACATARLPVPARARAGALALAAGLLAGSGVCAAADTPPVATAAPAAGHWQALEQYCNDCHNSTDWAGGVAFDVLDPDGIGEEGRLWESTVRKLRGRLMPPPGRPQPDQPTLSALVQYLEGTLDAAAATRTHAGQVTLHRLNRTEYANEIERLLGLRIDASEFLPRDTESEGFYNVASALSVSPTLFEQYLSAARHVSLQAVGEPAPKLSHDVYPAPLQMTHTRHVQGTALGTRGGMVIEHHFPVDGVYEFSVRVATQSGHLLRSYFAEYPHRLVMTVDGRPVFEAAMGGEADLKAIDQQQTEAAEAIVERFRKIQLPVAAGPRRISAAWVAKTLAESAAELQPLIPGEGDERVPHIKGLEVMGPLQVSGRTRTPSHQRIFSCLPATAAEEAPCAQQILSRLTREAFRRPVSQAEVAAILGFYEAGRAAGVDFEGGVQRALMALLSSPKFLYRADGLPADAEPGQVYALDEYALASRLAFFLWSQGPDEPLLQLAEAGRLSDLATLQAQTRRMLADPRSASLVDNFAMQWLRMGALDAIDPDPKLYPQFDESLRQGFHEEMRLFVDSILRGGRSTVELLTADYTFLNERLAQHYGVAGVQGERLRRVALTDSRRWGLLGKGGVLMASSYPDRTSPVLRGTWLLEALIGAPPAAAPPGVETNLASPEGEASTVRVRLELHRAADSCNQCHGVIDPLGLALENFDAIGQWEDRDRYAGVPIDASGQLAGGGGAVRGPDDLRRALAAEPVQFVQTLTEKLLMYALGRHVEHADMPLVRAIVRDAAPEQYRFESLVLGIVSSDPFRKTQVEHHDEQATQQVARQVTHVP